MLALIHVFLDNARYHHAKLVQDWLSRSDCRIRQHFVPAYCPHLNPIERLWSVMHKHVTHNKCYATFTQFADAMLSFLREQVPRNWANLRDSVTDNFRVISSNDFRGYGVNGVYKILKYRAKCATRALQAESDERGLIWGFGQ